ncbi:GMC family oxidoreductase N-terminal domain-containing protein [Aeromicrobium sp.]|jgi:choline dehydrogenase|uniref:GMC family oxidoreductase n=1 Tax=Aeromicrobium sp. TaxID=1871063 RepID=UPI0025BD9C65|nr:GMC family oxidoreductase N-terminal domain-containing protein [Aeromicrobium sp.]MCK5890298.1 GMC family oxidoreductase N-terminal domain-containing protein [Aeromicrobium sp.]
MAHPGNAYDFIVIGGGSAGCVLAHRLSASGSHAVLLIEAGGRDVHPTIHVPGLAGQTLRRPGLMWDFVAEPDASRDDLVTPWRAGRVLGGGSSVNGLVWVRGHDEDFNTWADRGCEGWDADSVRPFFERAESFSGPVGSGRRGRNGPMHIEPVSARHAMTDAFVASAVEAGHDFTADYNGSSMIGVGHGQANIRRGFRHSTARAYLGAAARRGNLRIATRTFARRLLFEDGRVTGVEVERRGRISVVRARREVVLAAGGMSSPKILMLSGVGPAEKLAEHGIPVVRDSPGVGQNLQEHPVTQMLWNVRVPTFNLDFHPLGMARHGVPFVLKGEGPAASSFFHALLFLKLDAASRHPEIECGFSPFAITTISKTKPHQMQMSDQPMVSAYVSLLHARSRGEIALRSADPRDRPAIRHQMFQDPRDLQDLIEGCRRVRDVFNESPLAELVVDEAAPTLDVSSDDEWAEHLRRDVRGASHATGACRMGGDDLSVVDARLRVRGVEGLRVADGSIMPEVTSGNTNAPIVMIGEKASDMILADA